MTGAADRKHDRLPALCGRSIRPRLIGVEPVLCRTRTALMVVHCCTSAISAMIYPNTRSSRAPNFSVKCRIGQSVLSQTKRSVFASPRRAQSMVSLSNTEPMPCLRHPSSTNSFASTRPARVASSARTTPSVRSQQTVPPSTQRAAESSHPLPERAARDGQIGRRNAAKPEPQLRRER